MKTTTKGIKVVDLTTYMATPATGRVLGEWGADVIKVEAAKGDPRNPSRGIQHAHVGRGKPRFRYVQSEQALHFSESEERNRR